MGYAEGLNAVARHTSIIRLGTVGLDVSFCAASPTSSQEIWTSALTLRVTEAVTLEASWWLSSSWPDSALCPTKANMSQLDRSRSGHLRSGHLMAVPGGPYSRDLNAVVFCCSIASDRHSKSGQYFFFGSYHV